MLSLNEDVNFSKITINSWISIFHNYILIKDLVKIRDFQNLIWFISNLWNHWISSEMAKCICFKF